MSVFVAALGSYLPKGAHGPHARLPTSTLVRVVSSWLLGWSLVAIRLCFVGSDMCCTALDGFGVWLTCGGCC